MCVDCCHLVLTSPLVSCRLVPPSVVAAVLAGMTPHRSVQPVGLASSAHSSPSISTRTVLSSSERMRQAESIFLSSPKPTARRALTADRQLDETERGDSEEAASPTDHTQLHTSSPSNLFPPLSPSAPSVPSPRVQPRRPSYMQPTQQEAQRQAELRAAQASREVRKATDRAKSTRRAAGLTNTDLFHAQQADLEARRLAVLEKEEAERKAERAKIVARFEAPPEARPPPATTTGSRGSSTARVRPTQPVASTSNGSQTSRAAVPSSPLASPTLSTSALLQQELQRREGQIRKDAMRAPSHPLVEEGSDEELDEDEDEDDEASEDQIDEERDTVRANPKSPHMTAMTAHGDGLSPNTAHRHLHAHLPVSTAPAEAPMPLSLTLTTDADDTADADHDTISPRIGSLTTVTQIYDPTLVRLLSRHEGSSGHPTGLDFLLASTKVKRAMREKKTKRRQASIQMSFGRLTEAQIERNIEALEKKKQIDRDRELRQQRDLAKNVNATPVTTAASHTPHGANVHAASEATRDAGKKSSFFPSLWRKITGS